MAPKGSHVSTAVDTIKSNLAFVPGARSIFEQELHAHEFRVAGRTVINGRPALRLLPTKLNPFIDQQGVGSVSTNLTMYVTPVTVVPIEETIRTTDPGFRYTSVERWIVYRVLPATSKNLRLLSLTARHPRARIIRSATAYLRAGQSQVWTVSRRGAGGSASASG